MHEKINQQQGAFKTERSFGFANPVSDWATARGIAASRALPTAGKCVSLGRPTPRLFPLRHYLTAGEPGILVVVTGNFLHEHHDPAPQGGIINSHERSDQP